MDFRSSDLGLRRSESTAHRTSTTAGRVNDTRGLRIADMQGKRAQVALVTNVTDFAGPPAVDALTAAGLQVLVHDKTFTDEDTWSRFSSAQPGAERVKATDPASLIEAAWRAFWLRNRARCVL